MWEGRQKPQHVPGPHPMSPNTYHRGRNEQQLGEDADAGLAALQLSEAVARRSQGAEPRSSTGYSKGS